MYEKWEKKKKEMYVMGALADCSGNETTKRGKERLRSRNKYTLREGQYVKLCSCWCLTLVNITCKILEAISTSMAPHLENMATLDKNLNIF